MVSQACWLRIPAGICSRVLLGFVLIMVSRACWLRITVGNVSRVFLGVLVVGFPYSIASDFKWVPGLGIPRGFVDGFSTVVNAVIEDCWDGRRASFLLWLNREKDAAYA